MHRCEQRAASLVGARKISPTLQGYTSTLSVTGRRSTASPSLITQRRAYGPERITEALRRAGLELTFDPPAVGINPDLYKPDRKPPIYERWEKHRKAKQRAETDQAELEHIADAWLRP